MNKIDIKEYVEPHWDVSDIVVEPSQELVEKWKAVLQFNTDYYQPTEKTDDAYGLCHNYQHHLYDKGRPVHIPALEEKDYLEVSRNLEYLERCYLKNDKPDWCTNILKWSIPDYRRRLTQIEFSDIEMHKKAIDDLERDIMWKKEELVRKQEDLERLQLDLIKLKEKVINE